MNKHLLLALFVILFMGSAKSQTNVSGNITQNTTWTKAGSPYILVGNVGVPSAYTLTIEPGVVVQRSSGYLQIVVNGAVQSAGTEQDSVAFISPDTAEYPVTYVVFKKSNLDKSAFKFVTFPSKAFFNILVGDEVFGVPTNPKNSGVLHISRSSLHGSIATGGINTTASVVIDSCYFKGSGITNSSFQSEPITITNSQFDSSVVFNGANSGDVKITNCQFNFTRLSFGNGNTPFSIDSSSFNYCEFIDNASGIIPDRISHSYLINSSLRTFSSVLSITDSRLIATDQFYSSDNITTDTNFIFAKGLTMRNCEMSNLTSYNISGIFLNNALEEVSDTIDNNRFNNLYTGVTVFRFSSIQLDSNDFFNYGVYDIVNNDDKDFSALHNYYELKDGQTIDNIIYDQNDNLNYGLVSYTPYAESPNTTVLPITLISFTGNKEGNTVRLNWQTSNEVNTSRFIVQRKTGDAFTDLGTVASTNKSSGAVYSFTDASPVAGNNYYRLTVADNNGKYMYSSVVTVDYSTIVKALRVYPNPATAYAIIEYSAADEDRQLFLTNAAGKLIRTLPVVKGSTQTTLQVSGLAKGVYKITVGNGAKAESKTLLIQ